MGRRAPKPEAFWRLPKAGGFGGCAGPPPRETKLGGFCLEAAKYAEALWPATLALKRESRRPGQRRRYEASVPDGETPGRVPGAVTESRSGWKRDGAG